MKGWNMRGLLIGCALALTAFTVQAQEYTLYYFYNNMRCATCRNFERLTTEVAPNLPVVFKTINTDEADNDRFVINYKLYTKSVVIADSKGNYKNLDKIWELSRNEDKFKTYITDEVNAFIQDNQ